MTSSDQIISVLSEIANKWQPIAIFWHVYFTIFILTLIFGIRPSKRVSGILLSLPLLSVSTLFWLAGNPFSGITFAISGCALIIIAGRLPAERVRLSLLWIRVSGLFMVIFGWIYPHFLETDSIITYLHSAPTGLIPCPTLSIVIGIVMILGFLDSRAYSIVLGAMGIFYGSFGVMFLSATLDFILLLGAIFILIAVLSSKNIKQRDNLNVSHRHPT